MAPIVFLAIALGLFIKSMDYLERPYLIPTLFLILCTLPNFHVALLVPLQIQVGFPILEYSLKCFKPNFLSINLLTL